MYLEEEIKDKKKSAMEWDLWSFVVQDKIPRQCNGSDCGVFMLKFADHVSFKKEIDFSQNNMQYFRQRICCEILQQKLMERHVFDGRSCLPDLQFAEDQVLPSRTKLAVTTVDDVHIQEGEHSFSHLDLSPPSQVLHMARRAYVNSPDQSFDSDGDFMEAGEQNVGQSLQSLHENHGTDAVADALPDGDVFFAEADRALLFDIIASVTSSDLSQRSLHLASKSASDSSSSVGPRGSTGELFHATGISASSSTEVHSDPVPSTSAQMAPHPNNAALNAVLPVHQDGRLLAFEYSRDTLYRMIHLDGTDAQTDPEKSNVPKPENAVDFLRRLLRSFSEPLRAAVVAEMALQPFQAAYNADRPRLQSNGVKAPIEIHLVAQAGQNEEAERWTGRSEPVESVSSEPVEVPVSMDHRNVAVFECAARDEAPNDVTPPGRQPPVSHPSNVTGESGNQNQEARSPVTRPEVKVPVVSESEFDIHLRKLLDADVDVTDIDKLASHCMKALDAPVLEGLLRRPEYGEPVLGDSSDDETFSVSDLIDDAIATVSEGKKEEVRRSHENATKEAQAKVTEPNSVEQRNKTKPSDQDVLDAIAGGMEAQSSADELSESDDEWSVRRPESEEQRDPLAYSSDSDASESAFSDEDEITKFMDHFMTSKNMSMDPGSDHEKEDLSQRKADEEMPSAADVTLDDKLLSQEGDVDEEEKKRREDELRAKCKFISKGCEMSDEKLNAELPALFEEYPDETASKRTKSGGNSGLVGSSRPSRSRGMRTLSLFRLKPPRKQVKEDEEPSASDSGESFGAPRPSKSLIKSRKRLLDSSSSDSDVSVKSPKRPKATPKPFIDISSHSDDGYHTPEVTKRTEAQVTREEQTR